MVSSTSLSMVSTLAGLRRLEAQIQHAMLAAGGATESESIPAPETLVEQAQQNMSVASGVIDSLDVSA